MKKIAIPVANRVLSAHFGHAPKFYIFYAEGLNIIKEQIESPPPHEVGAIPNWLAEIKVTDLITGGIGQKAIDILNSKNINVFTGAPVEVPEKIVFDFLSGKLKTSANLCNHNEKDNSHCEH